jgi:hypothetical protein
MADDETNTFNVICLYFVAFTKSWCTFPQIYQMSSHEWSLFILQCLGMQGPVWAAGW